jgi:hypothetical protein
VRERDGELEPAVFSTWAPVAIAMIGKLPGTLEDRSIQLAMRRRARGEEVERWRCDRLEPFALLASRCARWAADHISALAGAEPQVPSALHDRAADNWRPLLAIADAAGGEWPERARAAALALSGGEAADGYPAMLLEDIRRIFAEHGDPGHLGSTMLADELASMEGRPWPEISRGKPITTNKLAGMLSPFGIKPTHFRTGNIYRRSAFTEAWNRYLHDHQGDQTFTPSHRQQTTGFQASSSLHTSSAGSDGCEDQAYPGNAQKHWAGEGVKVWPREDAEDGNEEWRL